MKQEKCCKYLGILLDDDLTWSSHINYVYNKLLKFTGLFYSIRKNLTPECLKALYFALIYPHLNYAIELYGSATFQNMNPLQILQNKILRILQQKPLHSRVNELYSNFQTFILHDLCELNLLKLTHKIIHEPSQLPEIFHNYLIFNQDIHTYNTRHSNDIFVHQINSGFGAKILKFRSHQLWNSLPNHIKDTTSLYQFSKLTKAYYRSNYI